MLGPLHPETRGRYYFGDGEHAGYLRAFLPNPQSHRNPMFDSWKLLAIGSGGEKNPELEERFEAQARQPRLGRRCLSMNRSGGW
jgi:hypothetical protein